MLEVKDLTKTYGDKRAVNHISFTVNRGEIVGFLGPNGAGKTTTMNIITGYLSATSGTVTVDGLEILQEPLKVKKKIGYLPEQPPLYPDMTVKEYLNFMFDLKKVKLPRQEHLQEVCRLVKIQDVYERLIRNLSKGYRQRVGLAQALLGKPDLLILDEPTVGLDPKQIIDMRNLIKALGKDHTVLLSSHILTEVQAVCDRVVVINQGRIVANDTPGHLSSRMSSNHSFWVRIEGPKDQVLKALQTLPQVRKAEITHQVEPKIYDYTIEGYENTDPRRSLFFLLAEKGWPILTLRSTELTLEDIFLQLTEGKGGN